MSPPQAKYLHSPALPSLDELRAGTEEQLRAFRRVFDAIQQRLRIFLTIAQKL